MEIELMIKVKQEYEAKLEKLLQEREADQLARIDAIKAEPESDEILQIRNIIANFDELIGKPVEAQPIEETIPEPIEPEKIDCEPEVEEPVIKIEEVKIEETPEVVETPIEEAKEEAPVEEPIESPEKSPIEEEFCATPSESECVQEIVEEAAPIVEEKVEQPVVEEKPKATRNLMNAFNLRK